MTCICDRCGIKMNYSSVPIMLLGDRVDLCKKCSQALKSVLIDKEEAEPLTQEDKVQK